jgi:hypothetical protein
VRRGLSIIFLIIGGWVLMAEPMMAFVNFAPGVKAAEAAVLGIIAAIAAVPMAIGVALSPGDRRRELGLTILLATVAGLFCGAAAVTMFLDPGFKPFMPLMPPMPDIHAAPVVGVVNLVALTALGWWLYRGRARSAERAPASGS